MKEIILWKSLYYPGHEICKLQQLGGVWELAGTALYLINGLPSRLEYLVSCDHEWQTKFASIDGYVGNQTIKIRVEVNEARDWTINGQMQLDLRGCRDIDLGFTPATNTLPIRRLNLGIGESGTTRAAWLKLPEFSFSVLEQNYSHTADLAYLYESGGGNYSAQLSVNRAGLVTNYPELWGLEGEPNE